MSKRLPDTTLARTQVFARNVHSEDLAQLDAWLGVIADDRDDSACYALSLLTSQNVLERAAVSTTQ